jgi:hypothetical protein
MPVAESVSAIGSALDNAARTPEQTEPLPLNPADAQALESVRPGIHAETIERFVRAALAQLQENSQDVIEEEGLPLSVEARDFVADATSEIVAKALLSPSYSIEDFKIAAFARSDGGAHLLVDYLQTEKRLSFKVYPEGARAWVSMSGRELASPGYEIQSAGLAAQELGWLTKREPTS